MGLGGRARPGGGSMKWTERETAVAATLLSRGASEQEFIAELGRTKICAKARIDRVQFRDSLAKRAQEPSYTKAPAHLFEERAERLRATKSLTAILMGDPEPSRSALARRSPT